MPNPPQSYPPPLIAVDWGSTHFRAKLLVEGSVLDSTSASDGIRNLAGRDCETVLSELCGPWRDRHPKARVLVSGMAGAREGWREVPYVAVPCGIAEIAEGIIEVESEAFGPVRLVPGVRWDDPDTNTTDLMRGEETQVAGLLESLPSEGAAVCLPGTHSKWVLCRKGRIRSFRTWLTGEAYERLTRDSLVSGDGTPADPEDEAFALGVEAMQGPGGLLHHLFLGRTHMLAGRIGPSQVRSFVSGLLVGHEITEALAFAGEHPVHLLGESPAALATAAGLTLLGVPHVRIAGDTQLDGLLRLV